MIARFGDEWGRGAFRAMCRGRLWMPRTDRQRDGAFLSRVEVGGQPTVGAEGAIDPHLPVAIFWFSGLLTGVPYESPFPEFVEKIRIR